MDIISGIYKIVNVKNGKIYIGSSKNIKRRWGIHKSSLKNNRHHSVYLQRAWNKYGKENFIYEVIKEMPNASNVELLNEETYFVTMLKPEYNVGSIGGGDNLTHHPHRDVIIEKMTKTVNETVAKMSKKDKLERWSRPGEKNPNWKGGVSSPKCNDCGKQLRYGHKYCSYCSKLGQRNAFYGKKHTDEYKQKASEKRKGTLPANANPIVLNGVSYVSQADAARKLHVSIGTISNWINKKFKKNTDIKPLHQT
jgi:group I intron endonuclease